MEEAVKVLKNKQWYRERMVERMRVLCVKEK